MFLVTGVLIDTVSIQKYVYASNRLAENIGASNIVSGIYKKSLQESLKETLGYSVDINSWRKEADTILIKNDDVDFEVGYIGGGNALLFFKKCQNAKDFINNWTKKLLIEAPGLNVAVAIMDNFDIDEFKESKRKLFNSLRENKNKYFPQTFIPKYGITADCPLSGLSAEVFFKDEEDEGKYISSVSKVKLDNAEVSEYRSDKYMLPKRIDMLGQKRGDKNHIAIVHIDGNSIGEEFSNCETLPEIRELSASLSDIMVEVYDEFLEFLEGHMNYFLDKDSGFEISKSPDKYPLPFRPLLIAGDDITFLTDGRLGVAFAKKYLELMSQKTLGNGKDSGKQLSAAAGVAITKTKYPFYRGYILAEELCANAKKAAREMEGTSWLDFHVEYGGFSGSLADIRKERYTIPQGSLNFGPYLVSSEDKNEAKDNEKDISNLILGIKNFSNKDKWPRSKVKEFRNILTLGKDASEKFLKEMKIKGREPYEFKGRDYQTLGWENSRTPYFDMIELLELYPAYFMED